MEAQGNKNRQLCNSETDIELKAILVDLERQWSERTGELQVVRTCTHQTNLVDSEVLTNMGHEIAKPLNGVIGLARLMLESNLDANQRICVEIILQSCLALMRTLNDVVDLSGIEEDLAEKPDDITTLIDRDYVNKMKGDFPNGMYGSLLQQYCSDAEQTLLDLEYAVDKGDSSTVKNLLHLLKGCSANFGACAIVELCNDQTMGMERLQDMGKADMTQLKQAYEGTKDQLLQTAGSGC